MPAGERVKEESGLLEALAESSLQEDHFSKLGGIARSIELGGELRLKSWQHANRLCDLESARSECSSRTGLSGRPTSCEAGAAGIPIYMSGQRWRHSCPDVPGVRAELGYKPGQSVCRIPTFTTWLPLLRTVTCGSPFK